MSWIKELILGVRAEKTFKRVEARLGRVIGSVGYTGEKNLGELGLLKEYYPDYEVLRARSWQLYLESEIAQTIFGKYSSSAIGKGLKPQCEPVKEIFKINKIGKEVIPQFCEEMEAMFSTYASSRRSDYSGMSNLNRIAKECHKNAKVGGDVLVILRVDKKDNVTVQLIDGVHVQSPLTGSEYYPKDLGRGVRLMNGIELDEKNQHVAYHVRKDERSWDTQRISARNPKNGMIMAFMVYGHKYRIDNVRGMPLLAAMFETISKVERYKEATVGSAEERQKIAFTIEHDLLSTGESIFTKTTKLAYDTDSPGMIPIDSDGEAVANKVAITTNKQAINMPQGAKVKMHEGKMELSFGDFYGKNFEIMCASIQMPPEVGMSMYNSNYSASRASINDWNRTLTLDVYDFSFQFYKPIYDLYAHIAILKGKVKAPDYVVAYFGDNIELVEAYLTCRFVGVKVPHIDPLKEAQAERLKLGTLAAHIPLTTIESAIQNLGDGEDSDSSVEQFAEELAMAEKLGLKPITIEKPEAPAGKPTNA